LVLNNLGNVHLRLAGRGGAPGKSEETAVAFREALKERTRERVPLDWATSLGAQGFALMTIAERHQDAGMAERALVQVNTAFEMLRDGGNMQGAAMFEQKLPVARDLVARLRGR
jgi:hypothetical protein